MTTRFNQRFLYLIKKYQHLAKKQETMLATHHIVMAKSNLEASDVDQIQQYLQQGIYVSLFTSTTMPLKLRERLLDLLVFDEGEQREFMIQTYLGWGLCGVGLLGLVGSIALHFLNNPITEMNNVIRLFIPSVFLYLGMVLLDYVNKRKLKEASFNTLLQVSVLKASHFQSLTSVYVYDYQRLYFDDKQVENGDAVCEFNELFKQYYPLDRFSGYSENRLLAWLYEE